MGNVTDAIWPVVALLAGTFVLRPYVVGFLAFFLVAGARDLGRARTLTPFPAPDTHWPNRWSPWPWVM